MSECGNLLPVWNSFGSFNIQCTSTLEFKIVVITLDYGFIFSVVVISELVSWTFLALRISRGIPLSSFVLTLQMNRFSSTSINRSSPGNW